MPDLHDIRLTKPDELAARFDGLAQFDHVILAVSGGSDSIALLRLIGLWKAKNACDKPHVRVMTIDHGLRAGSAEDAEFVSSVACGLGFDHRTLIWQGEKPVTGVQEVAREARYDLLVSAATQCSGTTAILTAHTVDDQAETVLMRLARGSGPDGLAAIPKQTQRRDVAIVRPLIDVSRAELTALLDQLGQGWRDDPSNSLRAFERIRIRQARAARDDLQLSDKALAQSAQRMQRARQSLEYVADDLLQQAAEKDELLRFGLLRWDAQHFGQYGDEIGIRCLRRTIHVLGGNEILPVLSQTEALYAQMHQCGFRGTTLHGTRIVQTQNEAGASIFIFRETGRGGLPRLTLEPGMEEVWDRRFPVRTGRNLAKGFQVRPLHQDDLSDAGPQHPADLPPELRRDVYLTLPAIWLEDMLYSIPHLTGSSADFTVDTGELSRRLRRWSQADEVAASRGRAS